MIPFLSSLALFVFGTNGMDLPVLPMGALNPLGRLTAVGDLSDPDEDAAYGFDPTGNLTLSRVGSGAPTYTWAPADAGNRLGQRTSPPLEVLYDPAGRLTEFDQFNQQSRLTVFTYSPQDELLTVTPNFGTPVTRRYDALGRVYEENTVRKVYDGEQVLFDGAVRRRWGGLDEPWGTVSGTMTVTHQSVNFLGHGQDDLGPFGEFSGGASAAGFQGRPSVGDFSDFSGLRLWDHRARVYSPELKRFLTEDPHGLWGMNQYAFGGNDPVNFRDPSGLWAESGVNFATGVADAASFGLGPLARWLTSGVIGGQQIDTASWAYTGGLVTGAVGVGGIASFASRAGAAGGNLVRVTSWAEKGIIPDLSSGRWVQLGGPTRWNFLKTGLWERNIFRPPFKIFGPRFPFENSISEIIPRSSLRWPMGWEVIKGILGQRVIR